MDLDSLRMNALLRILDCFFWNSFGGLGLRPRRTSEACCMDGVTGNAEVDSKRFGIERIVAWVEHLLEQNCWTTNTGARCAWA